MAEQIRKRIALAFPMAVPHLADFVEGVVDYSKACTNWMFTTSPAWSGGFPETFAVSMKSLRGWHGNGVIAVITREEDACVARELGFPVVNLSGLHAPSRTDPDMPWIEALDQLGLWHRLPYSP